MNLTETEKAELKAYIKTLGYNPLLHPVDAEKFIQHWYKNIRPNKDKEFPTATVLKRPI